MSHKHHHHHGEGHHTAHTAHGERHGDHADATGAHPHAKAKLEDDYLTHARAHTPTRAVEAIKHGQGEHQLVMTSPFAEADRATKTVSRAADQHVNGPSPSEPVDKLVQAGTFKIAAGSDASAPGDSQLRDTKASPVKTIDVQYQDNSGDPSRSQARPDFIVHKDGSVEVVNNPDRNTSDKIVVQLERSAGDRGAPPAQEQQAADQLVGYLAGRYMPEKLNPDGTVSRDGQIQDSQGLISDTTKQALKTQPTADDQLTPEARSQVERVNRWHGSGGGRHGGDGGRFTPHEAAEQFAPRSVARQPGEDDKLYAMKDVASGFISRSEKDPYHAVHSHPHRGFTVGRYGISADQYTQWLMGLSDDEIAKLIKEGKLPKGALDVKHGKSSPEGDQFQAFLDKMKSGQGTLDAKEIDRFMPKQLQERMGSDLVKQYAFATADRDAQGRPARVDIGKTVLSMVLGHPASEEESKNPAYQDLMKAAQQAYPLALEHAMNGARDIDLSDASRKIAAAARADLGQQLWRNHAAATEWGNLGCAASVSAVLRDAGVSNVDQLGVDGLASALQHQGWQMRPFSQRRPGDVIIAHGGLSSGHTGVVGETADVTYDNHSHGGHWSRDAASYWGHWRQVYVLTPPSA